MVMAGSDTADDAAVLDFLRSSPWGRWVDHQVAATEMLNGVSATLTMTAFDHGGGDRGLVDALDRMFRGPERLPPGLDGLAGQRLALLAEKSRLTQAMERSHG
jgi:hypothetical protein